MVRQRLRPDKIFTPDDLKIGQRVFREWCGDNGCVVEVMAAADLCAKIAQALALSRADRGVCRFPECDENCAGRKGQ